MLDAVRALPGFVDVNTDREVGGLQLGIKINREVAARLGVRVQDINAALNNAFSQRQVSIIYAQRNQYRVILEIDPRLQRDPGDLMQLFVPGRGGAQVPLAQCRADGALCRATRGEPSGHFPAVTISYNLTDGKPIEDARADLQKAVLALQLPDAIRTEAAGNSAAAARQAGAQPLLILAALLTIYIVLGVLYESLAHPLTILSTLPAAGLGALIALKVWGMELSMIAFIGIILLIGIVKKNGIMLVDFALEQERVHGRSASDAVLAAARESFRPILMTTLAALFGAIPLAIATGPGRRDPAAARDHHYWRIDRVTGSDALHDAGCLSHA